MAKIKEVNPAAKGTASGDGFEPILITLAGQLGTFLGRMQAKADNLLENDAVQQQLAEVQRVAERLLDRVNEASKSARKAAAAATSVKSSGAPAKNTAPPPAPVAKMRSGGTVDAPGKRHRKPPPQEKANPRLGEVRGKHEGRKQFKISKTRGIT
jgi:hypothetical protein